MKRPAQQDWVLETTIMQQSVLFAAVRAPDGIHKNHPAKILLRWYRRCILISAFDKKPMTTPFEEGGGSFTGPFKPFHAEYVFGEQVNRKDSPGLKHYFDHMRQVYLAYIDELPHHFQLHFMHAAQIVGYKHPDKEIAKWWREFYSMIVNDTHLFPESENQMDLRLSDDPDEWRKREEVTAL